MDIEHDLLDQIAEFYRDYYHEDLATVARDNLPALWLDHGDIYQYSPDLADDVLAHPDIVLQHFEEAADMVDLPIDADLSDVTVRITGLTDEHTYTPGELRHEQGGRYVALRGSIERVTTTADLPELLVFKCDRCGTPAEIPQTIHDREMRKPLECSGCDRTGPFIINHSESEWSDYAKLRIESRPDDGADEGKETGYVLNDLIDLGGETGLLGRTGEPVTVSGIVHRVQKDGRGENDLLFDHFLEIRAIEFDRDSETVDVAAHRDDFEALAGRENSIDLFAESISPELYETDAWHAAMEFAVAYLFGAPRVDVPTGPTYRGDLHFLIVSDYGMGKSTFKTDIEAYSPKCLSKSTTALSSGVGLTAAAVKDDFGEGQWTIKPGLLVRANGGHLILDEIDKGPDELTEMNDAIEGEQVVDIEKAGKSATYESRTGVLALGNPVDGRFDPHEPISDQLGISESLLSRFDGIITMEDNADEAQDAAVAETYGKAYTEAQQVEHGDRDEVDILDRAVPIDVGQAWVKYARENVTPILSYDHFEDLKDWYACEVRQLNASFAGDGEGTDMPVPATVRVLASAVKMSIAFARCELCDEVQPRHVERAKRLSKKLVKQNWNGESFDAAKEQTGSSQKQRREGIVRTLRSDGQLELEELQATLGLSIDVLDSDIEKLKQKGKIMEPETGEYRVV